MRVDEQPDENAPGTVKVQPGPPEKRYFPGEDVPVSVAGKLLVTVPDLIGLEEKAAIKLLEDAGLEGMDGGVRVSSEQAQHAVAPAARLGQEDRRALRQEIEERFHLGLQQRPDGFDARREVAAQQRVDERVDAFFDVGPGKAVKSLDPGAFPVTLKLLERLMEARQVPSNAPH